jgi:hypothetical protein
MTPDEARAELTRLRALVGKDDDAAAAGADQLRCQVLHEIANGNPAAIALAKVAILTCEEDIGGD